MSKISIEEKLDLEERVYKFVRLNRKIYWEAEFEKGEYCIGEKAVTEFVRAIINDLS